MYSLAHLSDPHLGPLPRMPLRDLLSKRLFGFINWHRGRGRALGTVALAALTDALNDVAPDHIAVTGDLVNLAAEDEFATARQWLEALGPPADITVVPGNHDAYVPGALDRLNHHWHPFVTGDDGDDGKVVYPFVRQRGPIALIGLSSAIATMPLFATGRIGAAQVTALRTILSDLGAAGRFRVILIHHPPLSSQGDWFRRLIGSSALRDAVADCGAELILHGHNHTDSINWIKGKGHPVPVVGVPSASAVPERSKPAATFHLFRIDGTAGDWRCHADFRRLSADGNVGTIRQTVLYGGSGPVGPD